MNIISDMRERERESLLKVYAKVIDEHKRLCVHIPYQIFLCITMGVR